MEQENLQATSDYGRTRGEHNLEDETGEDSCSDYVSAESDTDDNHKEPFGDRNDEKGNSVLSSHGIKRKSQPKSVIIPPRPPSVEELEISEDNNDRSTFVPAHPGLPVMPSVPPQSPEEKVRLAAREGKVRKVKKI